jgi:prevent-host-death family protein
MNILAKPEQTSTIDKLSTLRKITMRVSSTEFQQNIGRYQDIAIREPVRITKNGRNHTVLVSADFFETVLKGRVARRVEDLDDATLEAIALAEVPSGYAHLEALKTD